MRHNNRTASPPLWGARVTFCSYGIQSSKPTTSSSMHLCYFLYLSQWLFIYGLRSLSKSLHTYDLIDPKISPSNPLVMSNSQFWYPFSWRLVVVGRVLWQGCFVYGRDAMLREWRAGSFDTVLVDGKVFLLPFTVLISSYYCFSVLLN